jgi:hypothetical protein
MKYSETATESAKQIAETTAGAAVYAGPYAGMTGVISIAFLAVGLYFVWRSFYKMRIPVKS